MPQANPTPLPVHDLAAMHAKVMQALPAATGYEKGFRDALESFLLALGPNCSDERISQALQTTLDAYANFTPSMEAEGGTVSVMMSDLIGNYDVPEEVPEWAWVEEHASYAHTRNGVDGIWEFMLNLAMDFTDIPPRLRQTIANARTQGASYVLFHQGT